MKERESTLKEKITKFRGHENDVLKLEEQLLAVWEDLGWSLEEHDTTKPEQIETYKRMAHQAQREVAFLEHELECF